MMLETGPEQRRRIRANVDAAKIKAVEMRAQVEHSAVGRAALAQVLMLTDVLELLLDMDARLQRIEERGAGMRARALVR